MESRPPPRSTVDWRADLYALGCVAYWLLTGGLVFEASSAMKMIMKHVTEAPAPPSHHTELPIPPELDAIVLSCLAKDPSARPASARELARQLSEVPLRTSWSEERAERWWRSHLPA